MLLAAAADGVDVVGAEDADGLVVEADALHAVDQVDKRRLFHARHFGAEHVLQFAVGSHKHHLRGGLHHHQVALFQDAVEEPQVVLLFDGVVGQGLVETAAVDGEDHLVVDLVGVRIQRIGVVGLAVGHEAVDDAVGGVLACLHGDFA